MEIFSLKINKDSYSDFFAKITKLSKQKIVFTPNPEILLESLTDKAFKKNLKKADYLVPDGIGLYLAAQLLEIKSRFARVLLLPVFIFNILFRKQ
jgi:N-acetylglucosaminyldiphosphoundecaprenol N-acetyl-beta-D-mannosaminyltransferase